MKNYLKHAITFSMILAQVHMASAQQLMTIDVNGRNGKNATHGSNYNGTAMSGTNWGTSFTSAWASGSGSNGRNGGDAGNPEQGQTAGSIRLNLSRAKPGSFVIQGVVTNADRKQENIQQDVIIGKQGNLVLKANGGNGGAGGFGGDGEGGGYGASGDNATESRSGTNGGNGGNGGNSGAGTGGGAAGQGGDIVLEMQEKDTALMMLVESENEGGQGGRKGKHGNPGQGGPGGSGGSSYSWTTTVPDGYDESTDANGNVTRTERTRTESHYNSGGSSGSSGYNGSGPTHTLYDGKDGSKGNYVIRVVQPDGSIKEYKKRYDLSLQSYDLVSDNRDGVIEPGERVDLKNIRNINNGGMPTPSQTKVRIFLTNSEYSIANSIELTIPKSLAAGEEFVFTQEHLSFEVKHNMLVEPGEERAKWVDHVQPLAEMTEVNRAFNGFSSARAFEITFPVEIEPITTVRSLAPGEKAKVMFKVTNLSDKDFGSESDIRREIGTLLKKTSGDLATSDFKLIGLDGQPWDMQDGFAAAIKNLKGKSSAIIEAELSIPSSAPAYQGAEIGFGLNLGHIEAPGVLEMIQNRKVTFRVTQTYKNNPDSKYLLVVNSTTNKEAAQAWKEALGSLGQKADVWDVSYYGHMGLTEALDNGSSLAQDFQGKTLIFLNNDFQTNQGHSKATDFLTRQTLIESVSAHGIGALVVGSPSDEILNKIKNLSYEKSSTRIEGVKNFLKNTKQSSRSAQDDLARENLNSTFSDISVSKNVFYGKVTETNLLKKATEVQKSLAKMFPERTYQVVYDFSPDLIKKGVLGIGNKWSLGSIQVYRTLDTHQSSVISLDLDAKSAMNPQTINSAEMKFAILLSTPFEQKLKMLEDIVAAKNGTELNLLLGSIQNDLMIEQSVLRKQSWSFGLNGTEITKRLVKLKQLSESKLKLNSSHPEAVRLGVMKIFSSLDLLGKESTSWWEYVLMGLRRNPVVNSATDKLAKQAQSNLFENVADAKAMKKAADLAIKAQEASISSKAQNINSAVQSETIDAKTAETRKTENASTNTKIENQTANMKNDRKNMVGGSTAMMCEKLFAK